MRTRLFLKIFFATAVPFGLIMGCFCGAMGALIGALPDTPIGMWSGIVGGITVGLAGGVLFGMCMAVILGALHFSQTDDPRVRHQRTLVIYASQPEARNMCVEALASIPNASVAPHTSGTWPIVARTGPTWRSWGDSISCDIISASPSQQTIIVESRPQLPTTIVDYGSNLQNVENVTSSLLELGASCEGEA